MLLWASQLSAPAWKIWRRSCSCPDGPLASSIAVVACKGGANNCGSVVSRSSRAVTCRPKQQFPVRRQRHLYHFTSSFASTYPTCTSSYLCLYVVLKHLIVFSEQPCAHVVILWTFLLPMCICAVCKSLLLDQRCLHPSRACRGRASQKVPTDQ